MANTKFPEFVSIEYKDKVALIDPKNKVCLKVSKRIADNIENQDVKEKIMPIWEHQACLQKQMEQKREKINTAYLMVTRQCNMHCDFCAINANEEMKLEKEITLDDVKKKIVPFFYECKPHKLIVSGGEPLLKEKIIEIIRILHDNLNCPITLQSNGISMDRNKANALSQLIQGIDFSTKHMFENKKKEQQLIRNIQLFQQTKTSVTLTFIYDKSNIFDLFKVIDIAAKYDTGLIINFVAPVGRAKKHFIMLNDFDRIKMQLDVLKYIREKEYDNDKLLSMIQNIVQVKQSCGGYGKIIAIFPEGNIYLCQCLENDEYKVGNVLAQTPEQIKKSLINLLQTDKVKATMCVDYKKICNQCKYRYLCTGKCPVSANSDDYDCYYIKAIINYSLFYNTDQLSFSEKLEHYIQYLEQLKKSWNSI